MKTFLASLLLLTSQLSIGAHAEESSIVEMPATQVIAVAVVSGRPADYAVAFGKLVGYYAQPNRSFQVVFPQMSISLNERSYAAIGVTGAPRSEAGIEVISLPACAFFKQAYVGNYLDISPAIESIVRSALAQGFAVNRACGIRILHLNSPDDTPVEKLSHELYVPVMRQSPLNSFNGTPSGAR